MPYVFNVFTGKLDFTNPGSSFDPHSPGPIGDVTPSTGAFTTLSSTPGNDATGLTITGGSITGSGATPFASLTGTWNTTGAVNGLDINITDTASDSASSLIRVQRSGSTVFSVGKFGEVSISTPNGEDSGNVFSIYAGRFNRQVLTVEDAGGATWAQPVSFQQAAIFESVLRLGNSNDLYLERQGNGIFMISNGAGAFDRMQLGGTSNAFPSIKRSSALLQARLADDSAFTSIQCVLRTTANAVAETPSATHTVLIEDASGTSYKVLVVPA